LIIAAGAKAIQKCKEDMAECRADLAACQRSLRLARKRLAQTEQKTNASTHK
jgi:hypothetical protein